MYLLSMSFLTYVGYADTKIKIPLLRNNIKNAHKITHTYNLIEKNIYFEEKYHLTYFWKTAKASLKD